jgi:hypothetical protein
MSATAFSKWGRRVSVRLTSNADSLRQTSKTGADDGLVNPSASSCWDANPASTGRAAGMNTISRPAFVPTAGRKRA